VHLPLAASVSVRTRYRLGFSRTYRPAHPRSQAKHDELSKIVSPSSRTVINFLVCILAGNRRAPFLHTALEAREPVPGGRG
jgi:hypothetical protein